MRRVILIIFISFSIIPLSGQQYDVDTTFTVEELIYDVLLQNREFLNVWNIEYTGPSYGIGYFYTTSEVLPLKKGIVMSTGNVMKTKGPNLDAGESTSGDYPGDDDLDRIANGLTYDAVVLEFDFITDADSICFAYFFGSEEYPEYVNDNVDDVFGFFIEPRLNIRGENIAKIPNTTKVVSIENINAEKNKEYFTANNILMPEHHPHYQIDEKAYERALLFELDGFTSLFYAGYKTIPGAPYHLKMAIADVGDDMFDSGVFLGESSFRIAGVMKSNNNSLMQLLKNIPHEEIVEVNEDSMLAVISVRVRFEYNSYEINPKYFGFLDQLVDILKLNPLYKIEINGHTDDIGSESYNIELSSNRASAIADYMKSKGINSARIEFNGLGNKKPLTDQKTDAARAKNRRVDFVLYKK